MLEERQTGQMRPEVSTRKGIFTGAVEPNGVLAFKGIPFAKPPVGRLRWREPIESEDSREHFDASVFKPIPVQVYDKRYAALEQSEDCLYLNIYTADLEHDGRPVLVWVYGGAYIKGGASYEKFSGDMMIEENPDLILVTVNYRLGVFGSLNLSSVDKDGEYRYSNNLARLDLKAALKWVHDNIAAFGGDPDNVTVWGHSAGSSNISAQLLMTDGERHFKRAVMHSSFALDIGITSWEDSLCAARTFLDILGDPSMEELLELPAERILEAQVSLQKSDYFSEDRKPFSVVEDDIVIPKNSFRGLAGGSASGIDALIGTCCGEYDKQFRNKTTEEKRALLKSQCGGRIPDMDETIRFLHGQEPEKSLDEIYMDIKNDLWLRTPANLFAQAMSRHSKVYMFHTMLRKADGTRAHHGCEYEMIFGRQDRELADDETARRIRQSWLNFVRCGTPGCGELPQWPAYDADKRSTMVLDRDSYVSSGVRLAAMERFYPLFDTASL